MPGLAPRERIWRETSTPRDDIARQVAAIATKHDTPIVLLKNGTDPLKDYDAARRVTHAPNAERHDPAWRHGVHRVDIDHGDHCSAGQRTGSRTRPTELGLVRALAAGPESGRLANHERRIRRACQRQLELGRGVPPYAVRRDTGHAEAGRRGRRTRAGGEPDREFLPRHRHAHAQADTGSPLRRTIRCWSSVAPIFARCTCRKTGCARNNGIRFLQICATCCP